MNQGNTEDSEQPGFTEALGNMANDTVSLCLMGKKMKYESVSTWLTVIAGVSVEGDSGCCDNKVFHFHPCGCHEVICCRIKELHRF